MAEQTVTTTELRDILNVGPDDDSFLYESKSIRVDGGVWRFSDPDIWTFEAETVA